MDTTLNKIREHSPCQPSWEKLLASLGKTKSDDEPISFKYLLDVLGIVDAVWCLRTLDYKEQCLFLADVAESVLSDFEKHINDPTPRKCIQAIRDYERGLIGDAGLKAAAEAVGAATVNAAAYAAVNAAYAAVNAAEAAAIAAEAAAIAAVAADPAKWKEIEALFIKHFVEE
ncbi:MAG: hypothetical protein GY830_01075 [Bacteroidetes bacterium]|nr:hypothetical protein [Bacteroidota bacterium]